MATLDSFSRDLGNVIGEAAEHAVAKTQANALVQAAATGGADAVAAVAQTMSTEELQRAQAYLQR
ncbi:hypothetical protein ACFXAZ_31360 [Streptomyces sp. NPDC059477]|uniref:hypothetical protein n=1 Tax=Streptomyces sp. NPDC059477 TaxID=3346847 RepID=UPI0036A57D58